MSRSAPSSPQSRSLNEAAPQPFEPDASVVLIGMRGSGKSTLAVIASTAMKRRIVDTDMAFQEATGLSGAAFKKTHGALEYHRRQYGVLHGILSTYQKDSIIISSWMEPGLQALLQQFATSHPVVHIIREQTAIAEYLRVTNEAKFQELADYSAGAFRGCGNYEFFNITEINEPSSPSSLEMLVDANQQPKSAAPYLTLKRAERHFLKFLSLIMPKGTIPFHESAFPLASIPSEKRRFTYAVSVPLSTLLTDSIEITDFEPGVDAIEIVVDDAFTQADSGSHLNAGRASKISRVMGQIRRSLVIPIIYHIAFPAEGFLNSSQRSMYLDHVRHGLRLAPEYLTVDLRMEDKLCATVLDLKRSSKVIGAAFLRNSSPPSWTDPIWLKYYGKARDLGCDLVRLLRRTTDVEDNFEINTFRQAVEKLGGPPLIAFNTGKKGRHSQCFNQILTSVAPESLAAGSSEHMHDSSVGYVQPAVTAKQATTVLHSSFVNDAMKLYVFGAKVDYSLSPAMHNTALKACGVQHHYQPISTSSLTSIGHLINDPLFAGASVGLPFKVEAISLTHSLSSHAKAIGAVNTLIPVRKLNPDGTIPENAIFFNFHNRAGPVLALYGENTDWIGIRACIRRGLSPANAVRPSTSGLIIGAGGMARAAVYAMLQLGVKNIIVYNRTPANAHKMVQHFTRLLSRDDVPLLSLSTDVNTEFHVIETLDDCWPADKFRTPTMIVSCIPTHAIGNSPAPQFVLPPTWMGSQTGGVVVEFAYKYLNTPLLEQVRAEAHRGWVPMDGLDLLPEQGFAQFELFTGRRAPRRLMREEVFRSYPDEQGESNQDQLQPRLAGYLEQDP